ncbi:MAG: heme o synthase [Anaerolineales bacterium]|nr:heme o synthase [Anaerolineales bacterium]
MDKALEGSGFRKRVLRGETPRDKAQPDSWRDYLRLAADVFKVRIVALLVLASLGGAFLGAGGIPKPGSLAVLVVTGSAASAGASALNQYLERERDRAMRRTRNRPLVTGAIENPRWILWAGIALVLLPVGLVMPWNPELAGFLFAGAAIYVGVYTVWLKPRTALNIVIGGAAGSAAVLSGGAAVGVWSAPSVITLALLIFLWTPAHFWALSMLYREDYQRAAYPMLPARMPADQATLWIGVHSGATVLAGLLLWATPSLGWLYGAAAVGGSIYFVRATWLLIQDPAPTRAEKLFLASNIYLLVLLGAVLLQGSVGALMG